MFVILNRANLVASITEAVSYVRVEPSGLPVVTEPENAEAVYSAGNDTFYPLNTPTAAWRVATPGGGVYHVEEVEGGVPDTVVAGYYYFSAGEFFMTPEKEQALAAAKAQREAPQVASILFVTLAESGQIDNATATEHAGQFAEWAYPVDYKAGEIRRDPLDGALYRVNEGQAHTSQQGWNPSKAPALWTLVGGPAAEWPKWV